jgi:putative flippase GtrA
MNTDTTTAAAIDHPAPGEGIVHYVLNLVRTKGLKYVLVSVVNVLVGGGLLVVFQHWMDAVEANIVAVAISAVPAYYMNRAWVWGKRGKSHWKKEVLPFWVFTGAGLVLSTVAIHVAEDHFDRTSTTGKFAILFVQLASFGVLWVIRFFVLDKLFHVEVFEDETPDVL